MRDLRESDAALAWTSEMVPGEVELDDAGDLHVQHGQEEP
jgi:hypothetical protein